MSVCDNGKVSGYTKRIWWRRWIDRLGQAGQCPGVIVSRLIPLVVCVASIGQAVWAQESRHDKPLLTGYKVMRNIPYAGTDNARQRLDLALPLKRTSGKPLPVIAFIHGGAWRVGSKDGGLRRIRGFLKSGKYAGVSIGYRLSDEAKWPAQIHDCKAAIRWIKARGETRPGWR